MTAMMSADRIVAGYGASVIVDDVSLAVAPGEIVALLGPNGSGKSTLMKALAGLIPLAAGTIQLAGHDIGTLDAPARAAAGLVYVPQEHNVFRDMTVRENLALAHEFLRDAESDPDAMLEMFPALKGRLAVRAGRLSGGERQMLAFACALMARPQVLLLDEPSAGLSPRYVGEIVETIKRVSAMGLGVVLVEQNAAAALKIARQAVVLVAGRIRHRGSAEAIARDADVRQLYLGGGEA